MPISSYIENLFTYFERFESSPASLDTEAFLQTYNGIYAVFQALRKERERAVEIDQYFLSKIKATPLRQSDLRLISIQLLISYFEVEADVDGQSNQAYLYCRGQREIKQDVPYFENHIIPMLFADGSLNFNLRLNGFFLDEIARYINRYGSPVPTDTTPEAFDRMSDSAKFLLLARRRLALGKDLVKDRATLEHHLQQVDAFSKLAMRGRTYREHLSDWGYLSTTSLWSRLSAWMGELFAKMGGAFSNWRYFRLAIRQRNGAYFLYSFIVIVAILLAVYVPSKWLDHSGDKLERLEEHSAELKGGGGK